MVSRKVEYARPSGIYSPYPSSCLASVQYWRPDFPKGIGSFKNYEGPISEIPYIGAVIITNDGPVDHGGQVIGLTETTVTFKECNYEYDDMNRNGVRDQDEPGVCGVRTLPRNSESIIGYD